MRKKFISILLLYVIAAIFLLPCYQYQMNADGISYISIAQKYMRGDLRIYTLKKDRYNY